jgi:hypothetical protein
MRGGGGAAALFHPLGASGGPRGAPGSQTGGHGDFQGPRVSGILAGGCGPGGGEGDTYSGMPGLGLWAGERSPPGAADMALIFSGAAWHGCMVPWDHGMRHRMAIGIAVWTSTCEEIVDSPCVWCSATCPPAFSVVELNRVIELCDLVVVNNAT